MEDFAKEALADGALFSLTFSEEIPARNFYVVNRSNEIPSPAAKALISLLN